MQTMEVESASHISTKYNNNGNYNNNQFNNNPNYNQNNTNQYNNYNGNNNNRNRGNNGNNNNQRNNQQQSNQQNQNYGNYNQQRNYNNNNNNINTNTNNQYKRNNNTRNNHQNNPKYNQNHTGNNNNNNGKISEIKNEDKHEDEECEKSFEESTHYYMIYGEDYNMWLLGIFVVIFQYVLYGIIIAQGFGDWNDDQVSVSVPFDHCSASNGTLSTYIVQSAWSTSTTSVNGTTISSQTWYPELVCEADEHKWGSLFLANVLAAIFLQYDYLASLKIMFLDKHKRCSWTRFAAFLIFVEAIMATIACSVFAINGWYDGSVYDAIMNTVGVLFIHDIDEKVYESVGIIKPNDKRFAVCGKIGEWARKSMVSWCTFVFIIILASIGCFPWMTQID